MKNGRYVCSEERKRRLVKGVLILLIAQIQKQVEKVQNLASHHHAMLKRQKNLQNQKRVLLNAANKSQKEKTSVEVFFLF